MIREFFANGSLFVLPVIAMGIFIGIFLTVVVRACQKSRAGVYRQMASLPLQDDVTGSNQS
ncbi:MAG: hypothetical protein JNK15_08065 [Planctomycetes bacterium]|nr:hypothetical protein [Planctomycetota bacterium]